jgi:hypothetical protein
VYGEPGSEKVHALDGTLSSVVSPLSQPSLLSTLQEAHKMELFAWAGTAVTLDGQRMASAGLSSSTPDRNIAQCQDVNTNFAPEKREDA